MENAVMLTTSWLLNKKMQPKIVNESQLKN